MLAKRIRDISEVIDTNFGLVTQAIVQNKVVNFEQQIGSLQNKKEKTELDNDQIQKITNAFQNDTELKFESKLIQKDDGIVQNPTLNLDSFKTFDQKISKLIEHQEVLIKISQKKNRKICTIEGDQAQSYFIFDSKYFAKAKEFYYQYE